MFVDPVIPIFMKCALDMLNGIDLTSVQNSI